MKIVGIIPARYHSTRFEGKPLVNIGGRTMIERVYRQARKAKILERVIVATDDQRIYQAVEGFGGEVKMTSSSHESGTDRVAEVVSGLDIAANGVVVNIQGDAPLLRPETVNELVKPFFDDPTLPMSTASYRIGDTKEISNPNVVKVAMDKSGFALYFSRSPIPYTRDGASHPTLFKHLGIYAYRREFLLNFAKLPRSPLEITEDLEQLRVLENGYRIKVIQSKYDSPEVNTSQDLEKIRKTLLHPRAL
jgi:3-deoxy-manno-octulosonate cytidylyltransferase (CMP-KDO synthetase)